VVGAVLHNVVKTYLFNPPSVAIGLAVGGLALLVIERFLKVPHILSLDEIPWRQALIVGLFQCLAFWPGVSRSAATIIGGRLAGLDRRTSAEFSFLIAVPTLLAGIVFEMVQGLDALQASDLLVFVPGFVVACASAWLAIRGLLRLLTGGSLAPFGWYRLALALVIWVTFQGSVVA
jgi:undecaprenyl-diphosphatase